MVAARASTGVVEPDIDRYGSKARASALADYLEVAALAGRRITRAALQDRIVENEWVARPRRQFYQVEDVNEDPATWVEAVFEVVAEREEQLGDLYPFEERGRALRLKDTSFRAADSPYVSLLALTVVHAWKLSAAADPEPTLEAIVAAVLQARGLAAVNIGATDRGTGFVAAVKSAGTALDLRPMDDPRPRSKKAKDAGVDTLGGVVWRDRRPAGQWLFIGQVTVAQSQNWKAKLTEPEPPRWAKYMQEPLHPQVFLAVPHHAEEEHIRDLLESQRGIIVDRLRLVASKPANTGDELELISSLMSADIVWR